MKLSTTQRYVPDARADWYAQRRAARAARFDTGRISLRERLCDRRCPLCGAPLGGVDRYVLPPIPRNGYSPRNTHREIFSPVPAPACLVACASCLRLYRGELCDRYSARNARRTPQE